MKAITAQDVADMIHASQSTGGIETSGGGTTITGHGLPLARLISLKSALSLESKGLRITRGFSALAMARRDYGIKARTSKQAYETLSAMFAQAETLAEKAWIDEQMRAGDVFEKNEEDRMAKAIRRAYGVKGANDNGTT